MTFVERLEELDANLVKESMNRAEGVLTLSRSIKAAQSGIVQEVESRTVHNEKVCKELENLNRAIDTEISTRVLTVQHATATLASMKHTGSLSPLLS